MDCLSEKIARFLLVGDGYGRGRGDGYGDGYGYGYGRGYDYGDKAYVTEVTYEDGCWCTQDGTCSLHEEFCGGDDVRVVGTNITDRLENFYENIHGNDYVKEEYL